jgi:hypothetical protein
MANVGKVSAAISFAVILLCRLCSACSSAGMTFAATTCRGETAIVRNEGSGCRCRIEC